MFASGDNKSGQTVGGGNTATNTTPKQINYDGPDVVKIACGAEFSMLVDKNGGVWSWGHPEHGQLGHNTDGSFLGSYSYSSVIVCMSQLFYLSCKYFVATVSDVLLFDFKRSVLLDACKILVMENDRFPPVLLVL